MVGGKGVRLEIALDVDHVGGWDSDRKTSKGGRASIEPNRGLASGIAGGVINVPPPSNTSSTVTDTIIKNLPIMRLFSFFARSITTYACAFIYSGIQF